MSNILNISSRAIKKIHLAALAILVVSIICPVLCPEAAAAGRGEKSFGPKAGFVGRNTSAMAGLVFQYSFSSHVRLSPEAAIIFRHKDLDALTIDLNVHFPMAFADSRAAFYPLVGLNFTSWDKHNINRETLKDVSTHRNRIGANAGLGVELFCTSTLKVSLEAKYTLMKTYPGPTVQAGIAYVF